MIRMLTVLTDITITLKFTAPSVEGICVTFGCRRQQAPERRRRGHHSERWGQIA
jgi:hypothetical protein